MILLRSRSRIPEREIESLLGGFVDEREVRRIESFIFGKALRHIIDLDDERSICQRVDKLRRAQYGGSGQMGTLFRVLDDRDTQFTKLTLL